MELTLHRLSSMLQWQRWKPFSEVWRTRKHQRLYFEGIKSRHFNPPQLGEKGFFALNRLIWSASKDWRSWRILSELNRKQYRASVQRLRGYLLRTHGASSKEPHFGYLRGRGLLKNYSISNRRRQTFSDWPLGLLLPSYIFRLQHQRFLQVERRYSWHKFRWTFGIPRMYWQVFSPSRSISSSDRARLLHLIAGQLWNESIPRYLEHRTKAERQRKSLRTESMRKAVKDAGQRVLAIHYHACAVPRFAVD